MMFLTKEKRDLENLVNAANNYELSGISLIPRSTVVQKPSLHYTNDKKEKLIIEESKGIFLKTSNFVIYLPENEDESFKIEYRNKDKQRVYEEYPQIGKPEITSFRKIIKDYEIEINFIGKIELEKEDEINSRVNYWKVK